MFEFQTAISELTGLPVANASLYEGPSSVASAGYLAIAATGRRRFVASRGVHPHSRATLETYSAGFGAEVVETELADGVTDPAALADALDEYKRAFRRPEVIAATCADYRAGAPLDDEHDRADLDAGRKIACPMLAAWSATLGARTRPDLLEVWRQYAHDVRGLAVDCGHFIPEEAPAAIAGPVAEFLAG
jgi:pimeloyl-ACP methyl ester carboxylesterase